LSGELERRKRGDWAREEFARLLIQTAASVPGGGNDGQRWRKLRGLGTLDRRRLGMVRELYLWREAKAEELNRPPRVIVRDDLLIEIVRRNPSRSRDLQPVRGLARRYLDEIVETLERARALPAHELPEAAERELDPPQIALVANVLGAVLADFAARNALAPNLLAASNDVKLLVRARCQGAPLPAESLLTRGWRAQHVLPELLAVLEGRRSLRVADVTKEAPFALADVERGA
jgi:ribonuclease D